MTLGFSQEIKGVKNFFVPKIWTGLMPPSLSNTELGAVLSNYHLYSKNYLKKFGSNYEILDVKPKLHTIRAGERWRAGMDIQMVINNRTKNRFQFAPTIKCKRVQKIKIIWNSKNIVTVYVDDNNLKTDALELLAVNDGFDSVDAFFAYFNTDFTGQLIHWTDLRY